MCNRRDFSVSNRVYVLYFSKESVCNTRYISVAYRVYILRFTKDTVCDPRHLSVSYFIFYILLWTVSLTQGTFLYHTGFTFYILPRQCVWHKGHICVIQGLHFMFYLAALSSASISSYLVTIHTGFTFYFFFFGIAGVCCLFTERSLPRYLYYVFANRVYSLYFTLTLSFC